MRRSVVTGLFPVSISLGRCHDVAAIDRQWDQPRCNKFLKSIMAALAREIYAPMTME